MLVSAQKEIRTWIIKVEKIKAIYHTLNMFNFDVSHNSLIAECWCPVSALENVHTALRNGEVSTVLHCIVPLITNFCHGKLSLIFFQGKVSWHRVGLPAVLIISPVDGISIVVLKNNQSLILSAS